MRKFQVHLRALLSNRRRLLVCLSGLILAAGSGGAWRIMREAQARLAGERERLERQNLVPFIKSVRPVLARNEIRLWQSARNTRAVARFNDSYYAATDGGLVQLSLSGETLRRFSVLDGLPESDLTSLAVFGPKLYLGTRTRGLAAFDGERFESYRWTDRAPQAINALLEEPGRLLVGTVAGGLIEFDGEQFRELKAGQEKRRLPAINCLAKDGARLYVGTFDDGLWIEEAGRWLHFRTDDGLLSNRVVGVARAGESLLVASDYGLSSAPLGSLSADLAHATERRFQALATKPSLSSMLAYGGRFLLCLDDGELFGMDEGAARYGRAQLEPVAWERPAMLMSSRLFTLDGDLWLLGSDGLRRARAEDESGGRRDARFSFNLFGQPHDGPTLSSNLISALAFDAEGKLWAGTFRNGIDILSRDGKQLAHLESEATREINYLLKDEQSKTMLAASSAGLLRFDGANRATRLTTADGLPSNSVLHAALVQPGPAASGDLMDHSRAHRADAGPQASLALATSKGLSIGEPGRLRALTTVQGLPSNSLYAVLAEGRVVYAGTLGGLAVVEAGRVVRVFKDSNSNLAHNWVTSLCAVGPRLFVGTYGGVFELTAAGEIRSFASEVGGAAVNPNAMWSDGARLYVGTLDGARVYDLRSQKWAHLEDELPSRMVLSVTGDDRYVYFGTTSGIARFEKSYMENL